MNTAPETTIRQVWLARCYSCGWQSTYAKATSAKTGLTKHEKRCPKFTPPQQRSWWRP